MLLLLEVLSPLSFFSHLLHSTSNFARVFYLPSCYDLATENIHLIWDILPSGSQNQELVRETSQEFGEYDLGVSKS